MSRLQVRPLLAVAALAAISGCAAETGYQLPELPQSGGSVYAPYSVYRPGYYFGYPGYDPRYYGYGAYNPYAYQGGPYPYGYGYYPYPRYVVVPCVDSNHDGHCDRHPGKHDDDPPHHGNGHGGHGHGGGDDGRPNQSTWPSPAQQNAPKSQSRNTDRAPQQRPSRDPQDSRDDTLTRP
jgi:hypothetical protein